MPGRGADRPVLADQLLRGALEVALVVARRRSTEDPPVPAPRGLVPFLGFARLPDRALAPFRRVLDDDEGLRRATRDAADEASVGRASWLFLDRPVGWEEELDRLTGAADVVAVEERDQREEADLRRRLVTQEAARRRSEEEVVRLSAELAAAKELLAGERRARRRSESDAGRLRRRSEDLASEIEAGRQREAHLRQLAEEARVVTGAGVDPPGAVIDVERRQDARRDDRALDQVALTEAVDAATGAAGALSEALAQAASLLAAVGGEPDDGVPASVSGGGGEEAARVGRRPVPLPPNTFDDSVAAADHLVRVGHVRVLVDGYNVTKLARPHLSLPEQRGWLVDAAVELAARTGASVELVFDGAGERASAPADLGRRVGVQVRFSPEGTEADDLLLDLLAHTPAGRPVVVASDDLRVQAGARRLGANVITSPQLLAVVNRPI